MSGLTPVQRTMRHIREQGGRCEVVERFNPHVGEHGVRHDLFGIVDVLALDPSGFLGIQCCGSDIKPHIDKLTIEKAQETRDWLSTPGGKLQVWGWRKVKAKRGGKAMIWAPRIQEITMNDITGHVPFEEGDDDGSD